MLQLVWTITVNLVFSAKVWVKRACGLDYILRLVVPSSVHGKQVAAIATYLLALLPTDSGNSWPSYCSQERA